MDAELRRRRKVIGQSLLIPGLIGLGIAVIAHLLMQDVQSQIQMNPLRLEFDDKERAKVQQLMASATMVKYTAGGLGGVLAFVGLVLLLTLPPQVIDITAEARSTSTAARQGQQSSPELATRLRPGDASNIISELDGIDIELDGDDEKE